MRRIIFSIAIFLFSLASVMGQKIPINLPADGNWPTIVGDSIMIIGPRQNELTEEQRYFNPIYLMVYPGKEHLQAQIIRAGLCDCDLTKPNRRIGVFSVAPDKQVSFSQGNLQCLPAINLWKFADTQYEYLGTANKYIRPTFRNWVDLFGWSANNTTAPFGVSTSTNAADYVGDFVDWGTNTICGDAPGTWRMLSVDEWDYLINKRTNAKQLCGMACVHGANGLILLPDDWIAPTDIPFTSGTHDKDGSSYFAHVNDYTIEQWQRMEELGAVFLPTAGVIRKDDEIRVGSRASYWSSTGQGTKAYILNFHSNFIITYNEVRYAGRSVRLVHDTIVPEPPKRIGVFSVAADKQVSFSQGNLQYTQSTDTWQFAKEQYEYIGAANIKDGALADKIDLFGWSANNTTAPFGVSMSTNNADYAGEFVDWGTNIIQGDAANTWRTLSKEEWEYLIKGRKNASNLRAAAQVNRVNGMILLPDDWECPEGIDFKAGYHTSKGSEYYAEYQQFTKEQWRELETIGAIFLPAAGMHDGNGIADIQAGGYYWSATDNGDTYAYTLISQSSGAYLTYDNRYDVRSVRLVHDTIVPEYVDLGLSVKWATFNVGASKPEDYGDYFAWGETETKDKYSWATYKWCDGTSTNMTKYNTEDGKTILDSEDDAAYVNWGGNWRMPSKEEVDELTQQCNWIWTTHNNVNGYKVTGPNGNSIFLPAAGYKGSGPTYPEGEDGLYWTNTTEQNHYSYLIVLHDDAPPTHAGTQGTRCFGFTIRPVYDDRPTLTVIPTPEDAKVSFLCIGYQAVGHSITVDKGKNVLYQVTNVDAGYLSQGDSIYNLINDSVLYVTLRPFSDGNWVVVDNSELTKYEDYYISRNGGSFAGPYSNWDYYVLPVMAGETYRVRAVAGQLAPVWFAASTAPDLATKTRPKKVSCSDNKGVVAYVADEVTIPEGTKYLIINNRRGQAITVERKVPDPCLVVKVNDTLSINLMCVEGGTFRMGAMEGDTQAKENEKPAHEVTLTYDYLIMQTEVTQGLWEAVMGEDIYDLISKSSSPTAKPISTRGDFPVGYVQLSQCLEFIDRLNELTGMHFRMPTEAEWEYAARGGNQSKGYLYAGSNTLTQVAQTSLGTVAKLRPNELGIYDMSGNIAEMTLDYLPNHDTGYPSANAQVNPRQISPTGNRAIRGLRWNTTEINCRISHRNAYTTIYSGNGMGFRLVLSKEQDFRTIHFNGSYFDMSFVKGGTFMMGSDAPDAQADEQPVHEVTLSDYYIGQTEVTQHLWKKVMGDENNPSATKGNNLPVTNITWDEAQVFVERLSELTGMHFRLPTEAEWEYAARGGQKSKGYTYAGSNDIDQVGWYNGNSSNKTHAVGQKQPNELGIYDMTGNVWEYCSDWHMPYAAQAQTNPTGAATGDKHVLRGGCYHYDSKNCTSTNRHSYYTPDKSGASTGLRIVLEP